MRFRPVVAALAAALLMAACGSDDDSAAHSAEGEHTQTESKVASPDPSTAKVEVLVKDLKYQPTNVTVAAGEAVRWEFDDGSVPHDVKFDKKGPHSPHLKEGEWAATFDKPGTYSYLCTLHPFMKGKVTVT